MKAADMQSNFRYNLGVIHGRFQIMHLDHIRYIKAGKALCRRIVVGITNPDPVLTGTETADPERSQPIANPLSYYERLVMTTRALLESGIGYEEFHVVPFPINYPERYKYYAPLDATFFLTIYDDWGRKKRDYFQSLGLNIHVLWDVPPEKKGISSTAIREAILNNTPWEHLVTPGVAELMHRWEIGDRLRQISERH